MTVTMKKAFFWLRVAAFVGLWFGIARTWAAGTRVFRATTYQEFSEGQEHGVHIRSQGEITIGYSKAKIELPHPGDDSVRAMARSDDGTTYVGTGGETPNVYRLKDGKLVKWASLPSGTFVSALAVRKTATGHRLLAATLTGGRIFDIGEDGQAQTWATVDAEYIWAMARHGTKTLLATAPGRLLLLDDRDCEPTVRPAAAQQKKTKTRTVFETSARHVLSLARADGDAFYVGTSDDAILYRIELPAQGPATMSAVHDFAGNEVRAIVERNGVVFVAVNDMQRNESVMQGTKLVLPAAGSVPGVKPTPPTGTTTPPSTSPVEKKGRGALFRIDPVGRVEQLHAISDGFFNDLVVDADEAVLAAASMPGSRGRVFRVLPDRTVMTALELSESDALTLQWNAKQHLVGTGSAAGLYSVGHEPPAAATYQSKVFDATVVSRFGALRFLGEGVVAETRSGNVQKPDTGLGPWQPLQNLTRIASSQEQVGQVASLPGRYLQVRFSFRERGVLKDFFVSYQPVNLAPRLTEVSIGEEPLLRHAKGVKPTALRPKTPLVKIRWKTENPDSDELNYQVFVRRVQSGLGPPSFGWLRISGAEPLTRSELEWNTETLGDGLFEAKVTVSDERSNPDDRALSDERLSEPFLVDNRRPDWLEARFDATTRVLTAKVADTASPIVELSLCVDGGECRPLSSRDGILDGLSEDIRQPLTQLPTGTHTLLLRAMDASDNVATTQLVIQTK